MDLCIQSLCTYFNTHHKIYDEEKIQIARLQMEVVSQAWWDTLPIGTKLIVDLQESTSSYTPPIGTWESLCQVLCRRFYPLEYC